MNNSWYTLHGYYAWLKATYALLLEESSSGRYCPLKKIKQVNGIKSVENWSDKFIDEIHRVHRLIDISKNNSQVIRGEMDGGHIILNSIMNKPGGSANHAAFTA